MAETNDSTATRFGLLEIDPDQFALTARAWSSLTAWLGVAIDADHAEMSDKLEWIRARKRDWNAKGNGTEETRRVRLPDGSTMWAADAGETKGGWAGRGMLAGNRHCEESVSVPVGTLIVAFDRSFKGGQGSGRADVTAGIVLGDNPDNDVLAWDVKWRRKGEQIEVWTPARGWCVV